jgi:hypothetical protein
MAMLYGIWLHTTKNEEYKFYGSMVEKSTKIFRSLYWTKSAIWRYNNCQSYRLTMYAMRTYFFNFF